MKSETSKYLRFSFFGQKIVLAVLSFILTATVQAKANTELANVLHAQGKSLSMEVSAKVKDIPNHPRSTFFDYDALAQQADTLFVMCWGIHWRTSGPGAIDDMTWASQVATYVSQQPTPQPSTP